MSKDLDSVGEGQRSLFRPFTRESLAAIESRRAEENEKPKEAKKKRPEGEQVCYKDEGSQPDETLEEGVLLPAQMQSSFPLELVSTPLEDMDPYYHNHRTFVVISKGKYIFRFSASNALWVLGPFNPLRRAAVNVLVHPLFSLFIITAILVNCIFMMIPVTPTIESAEYVFIVIYTFEFVVKVFARGFLLQPFTYLRDPWTWLDFVLLIMAYLTLGIDIENMAVLRTFRVLLALKTVGIVPSLRTIAGAVTDSIINLGDVIIVTIFSLSVFAVVGLQIYMGVLTQKCIKVFPQDGTWGNLSDETWENFTQNETNWYKLDGFYPLCGNSSGAGQCEPGYICLQGYGLNPNYGYTNFDTFGWAFLSAFRLMTQDYWENLYQLVLRSAGPWHVLFFIVIITMASLYLVNLVLAIVVLTYNKLKKKADEEKKSEEALQEINTSKSDTKNMNPSNNDPTTEQPDRKTGAANQNAEDEDKATTTCKEKFHRCGMKVVDFFCVWDCCKICVKFQKGLALIVFDPFFELFIIICIVFNTLFMALDHHDMDRDMERVLRTGNYIFVAVFFIEAMLKIIAMSPKHYFLDKWNVFDFSIVFASLMELGLEGVHGLSLLRSLRVFRVFRLAKSWPALNDFLFIMGRTTSAFVSLIFVFWIIIFIFAVLGMQMYGKKYVVNVDRFPDEVLPRWNFTDFLHSFMMVFRILCGEWIESMWDCMLVGDDSCIPFFLATVVICNFVVLNLFLALLLSNFDSTISSDEDTSKIGEAFNRISKASVIVKRNVAAIMTQPKNHEVNSGNQFGIGHNLDDTVLYIDHNVNDSVNEDTDDGVKFTVPDNNQYQKGNMLANIKRTISNRDNRLDLELKPYEYPTQTQMIKPLKDEAHTSSAGTVDVNKKIYIDKEEQGLKEDTFDDKDISVGLGKTSKSLNDVKTLTDCCPKQCYQCFQFPAPDKNSGFCHRWDSLRLWAFKLINSTTFETTIIIMIILSSITLTFEDIHLAYRPLLREMLFYTDIAFTVIFLVEMMLKWLGLGFEKYFTNAWCWLDFIIVMTSLINNVRMMASAGNISVLQSMRSLRSLRALCAAAKWESMRVVINSLTQAMPSIASVFFVCLYLWLIFAILGVQFFAGKYYKCVDINQTTLSHEIIPDRKACVFEGYTWENSPMNFDHVGNSYLSLFQVATFKGWIQIMNDAVDSREVGVQPIRETNIYMYLYFIFFIIFGSFFVRYLFIGVMVNKYKEQKNNSSDSLTMFMTKDQKKYYNAMKKIKSKKPLKAIPKPKWRPQAKVFEIVTNKKFDMMIMLLIGLNMLILAFEHYQQTATFSMVLDYFNMIFIIIFTAECVIKIFGLRHHYFVDPWNLYDFFVVILSILSLALSDIIEQYFISPTLLRIARVAKICRILRHVKGAKGNRMILYTLRMSIPALFSICLLLFLVMFIYAIFGMTFFMHVKSKSGIDDVHNFQTFGQSMILLFQLSTFAGWDGVLDGITNEKECELPAKDRGLPGNCGSSIIGNIYLLSYLVISYFIFVNMYIAIIFENYCQAMEDVEEGLTEDEYDVYYEIWQRIDPDGSQYIRYDQLSDFFDVLERPLQIRKPNQDKIKSMHIPINRGGMVFCVDVLDALAIDFFARKSIRKEKPKELDVARPDEPSYEPVSTRQWRKREDFLGP